VLYAIDWIDKALDKINSRDDPREFLDIHVESLLEVENDRDFNEQGSYFISSDPCSYEKSPDSVSLKLPHMRSSTLSCSLFLKFLKGWL